MGKRLNDKVVLITGTGGGQGRAAALLFAREGAKVIGCDLKVEGARETVAMVRAADGQMVSMEPVDLADPGAVQRWVDFAVATYGRIDVLYNNASAPKFAPFDAMTFEDWQFTLRNELDLMFLACKAAWPHLKKNGGSIVNTSSAVALTGVEGLGSFAHSATKAGVLGLTRQLAAEGAKHGVRVNAICPGIIESPGTAPQLAIPELKAYFESLSLLPRIGTGDDVAYAALYLASNEAGFVTGTTLAVDGGWSIKS